MPIVPTPPAPDELEVTVFGPGRGEAIAVHVGHGDWILVDSCRNATGTPASLVYLKHLGVDPAESVKLVVCTHWHDDHAAGLADIVDGCPRARFALSAGLRSREFLTVTAAAARGQTLSRLGGVDELHRTMQLLMSRKTGPHPESWVRPRWATNNTIVWDRAASANLGAVEVRAMSPSDKDIERTLRQIAALVPPEDGTRTGVPSPSENEVSVALIVTVGSTHVLLGADLEEPGDALRGWSAVVSGWPADGRKAEVFKVAHHGSAGADQPRVWQVLLEQRPWAIVTPFIGGNVKLPTRADVRRLKERTDRAWATSVPRSTGSKRPRQIEELEKRQARRFVPLPHEFGCVQLRKRGDAPGSWSVALDGRARLLDPAAEGAFP